MTLVHFMVYNVINGSLNQLGGVFMATTMKRLTISLPDDIARNLDEVKKRDFLNSPQSKVIWHLLRLGIEADRRNDASDIATDDQAS